MALTCTLTQVSAALMGEPCRFTLKVQNPGGSTVFVRSLATQVIGADGRPAPSVNVGKFVAAPNLSQATTQPYQFNVPVTAGGTVYFQFNISYFAQSVGGSGAGASGPFVTSVLVGSDEPATYTSTQIGVSVNAPQFGPAPGSPPNQRPSTGALQFYTPANSALTQLVGL